MRFLTNPSTDPWYNMSFDEYCLEQYPSDDSFFYLWRNAPSVIIGLNQNAYSEVNLGYLQAHDIRLARRVTGGGAVYHDLQNLNYTITGRVRDLEQEYPEYLHTMVRALRTLGVPAELTGRNDIFVDGRAALRPEGQRGVAARQELLQGGLQLVKPPESGQKVL